MWKSLCFSFTIELLKNEPDFVRYSYNNSSLKLIPREYVMISKFNPLIILTFLFLTQQLIEYQR